MVIRKILCCYEENYGTVDKTWYFIENRGIYIYEGKNMVDYQKYETYIYKEKNILFFICKTLKLYTKSI